MSRVTSTHPRVFRVVAAALATATALAAFTLAASAQPTRAAWQSAKTLSVTVSTVTPVAPTNLRCVPTSGSGVTSMQFQWDAPATGPTPTGYTISFNGGSAQNVTTGTSYTLNAGLLSLGSYPVRVVSYYGSTTWTSGNSNTVTFGSFGLIGTFSYNCT